VQARDNREFGGFGTALVLVREVHGVSPFSSARWSDMAGPELFCYWKEQSHLQHGSNLYHRIAIWLAISW
jgi:hypothetical protein